MQDMYIRTDQVLDQIAKQINEAKSYDSFRERLEKLLPDLRALWKSGQDGDDIVPINRLVKKLNTLGWRWYRIVSIYTRQGQAYQLRWEN